MAIDDITTLGNVNFAFIAIAEEPKTYQEAIHSPHSKQWEQAIKSEFAQLQTSRWLMAYLRGERLWAAVLSSVRNKMGMET